jgi:hypothetical protein
MTVDGPGRCHRVDCLGNRPILECAFVEISDIVNDHSATRLPQRHNVIRETGNPFRPIPRSAKRVALDAGKELPGATGVTPALPPLPSSESHRIGILLNWKELWNTRRPLDPCAPQKEESFFTQPPSPGGIRDASPRARTSFQRDDRLAAGAYVR